MSQQEVTILVALAGAVGAVVSVLIGGILTVLTQWLTRRSEERKHFLDLCFKAATDNLLRDLESAKAQNRATGNPVPIGPLDLYLIHMLSLIGTFKNGDLSQEKMITRWVEISSRTRAALVAAVERDQGKNRAGS